MFPCIPMHTDDAVDLKHEVLHDWGHTRVGDCELSASAKLPKLLLRVLLSQSAFVCKTQMGETCQLYRCFDAVLLGCR